MQGQRRDSAGGTQRPLLRWNGVWLGEEWLRAARRSAAAATNPCVSGETSAVETSAGRGGADLAGTAAAAIAAPAPAAHDRKSAEQVKCGAVRVDFGDTSIIKKNNKTLNQQ